MLNQLIYTRCMPHRELKNKGQVVRTDGFGVFSMSQGMVTNPPISNYDFLQTRLAVQNGAKETSATGLFNSYEYTALSSDIYAMSFEVARPHCKEPRKNGQGHRTGTYIKQCLVGKTEDYPFNGLALLYGMHILNLKMIIIWMRIQMQNQHGSIQYRRCQKDPILLSKK